MKESLSFLKAAQNSPHMANLISQVVIIWATICAQSPTVGHQVHLSEYYTVAL